MQEKQTDNNKRRRKQREDRQEEGDVKKIIKEWIPRFKTLTKCQNQEDF